MSNRLSGGGGVGGVAGGGRSIGENERGGARGKDVGWILNPSCLGHLGLEDYRRVFFSGLIKHFVEQLHKRIQGDYNHLTAPLARDILL